MTNFPLKAASAAFAISFSLVVFDLATRSDEPASSVQGSSTVVQEPEEVLPNTAMDDPQYEQVTYSLTDEDLNCLAKNIYFEAAHTETARLSIAQVTMNRYESGRWGNSVCSVVYWKSQFSWTVNSRKEPKDTHRWQAALAAAENYLAGARVSGLEGVLHYHADYLPLRPWAKKMKLVLKDGGHLFFKEV